ncbi:Alpha/Beta hydrolase protein [Leptodontidium sp. 2 PMI_412]|nr:Alpha/Beta hydrolase protein [Leptodontidium sp. 2 PMI_412]
MSEKKGPRQSLKRFVSRFRSESQLLRDGTLDPGESVGGASGPSNAATSTTASVINPTPSPDTPKTVVTPSDSQLLGDVSPTGAHTTAARSASPQSRFGLFLLTRALNEEELRQGGVDIVAIHGITGDYERTWTHPEGALWLKDFLPNDLSVPTRVFSFGYDAQVKFSVSKARLDDFARSLLQALNRVRRGKDLQSRALIFICHSMGGLVIKQALVVARLDSNLYPGVQSSTKGIVFLSTPHRGSSSTDWPITLGKALNAILKFTPSSVGSTRTDLLETLKTNSDELQRLATDFRNQAVGIKIVSCYEMNITPPLKALIVNKQTGTLDFPGEARVPMEGCNHNEVCRFSAQEDTNYQNVLTEILELVG